MGQYFVIVNLDKKEMLHPHKLGSGLKLWEIVNSTLPNVLPILLRQSNERGGGDITQDDCNIAGRWAGDRLVVVGDYDQSGLFSEAMDKYNDISLEVRDDLKKVIEFGKRWDVNEG